MTRKHIASIQCPIITLGNARVIYPGISACIDCTLDLFPPQINFPLCTIAHTPRLPEHCIEYVRMLLWNKENPFTKEGKFYRLRAYKNPFEHRYWQSWSYSNKYLGEEQTPIDGDDPQHITWIHEKANERAAQFNISGVTYRLTQVLRSWTYFSVWLLSKKIDSNRVTKKTNSFVDIS